MGSSVIDLCCVPYHCLKYVRSFRVLSEIFSDHMPIELTLNLGKLVQPSDITKKFNVLLPKLLFTKKDNVEYPSKILEKIKLQHGLDLIDTQQEIDNLIDCVKQCAERGNLKVCKNEIIFKKPWYDFECFKLRKISYKLLNIYRRSNSTVVRELYTKANSRYKQTCIRKNTLYYENLILSLNKVNNSKDYWAIINAFKKRNKFVLPRCTHNELINYFRKLLNPCLNNLSLSYAEPLIVNHELDKAMVIDELIEVLAKAKINKAPGGDRVPVEFYKNAPREFLNMILKVFNNIYDKSSVPASFVKAIIFPLYKRKGDEKLLQNFRGLSFIDSIAKLFAGILKNRLVKWLNTENLLHEFQAGFRAGYSTVDQIFALYNTVQLIWAQNSKKKVYAFFVDFRSAFDRVDRRAMFYKLYNLGVSTKMLSAIKGLFHSTSAAVWTERGLTDDFEVTMGVKQGCVISPVLFALYLNDLYDELDGGVTIAGLKIKLLAYADDVVIVADNIVTMRRMIGNLECYCEKWNLEVNLAKSRIVVFKPSGGKTSGKENWYFRGNPIVKVNEYEYLGIKFSSTLNFKRHLIAKLSRAKLGLNSFGSVLFSNKNINFAKKLRLFHATSRSVLCYGAQVWGWQQFDEVEKIQRFFLKKIFGLPQNTPTYFLLLETGLNSMYMYTYRLHIRYVGKVLLMADGRLPKFLAKSMINKKLGWAKEWLSLVNHFNIDPGNNRNIVEQWDENSGTLLRSMINFENNNLYKRVNDSTFHSLYKHLKFQFSSGHHYLTTQSFLECKLIIKIRSEMINLRCKPWISEFSSDCLLCNMGLKEDLHHFLVVCPALENYRLEILGEDKISTESMLKLLNGHDWSQIVAYVRCAYKYRQSVLENCT